MDLQEIKDRLPGASRYPLDAFDIIPGKGNEEDIEGLQPGDQIVLCFNRPWAILRDGKLFSARTYRVGEEIGR